MVPNPWGVDTKGSCSSSGSRRVSCVGCVCDCMLSIVSDVRINLK